MKDINIDWLRAFIEFDTLSKIDLTPEEKSGTEQNAFFRAGKAQEVIRKIVGQLLIEFEAVQQNDTLTPKGQSLEINKIVLAKAKELDAAKNRFLNPLFELFKKLNAKTQGTFIIEDDSPIKAIQRMEIRQKLSGMEETERLGLFATAVDKNIALLYAAFAEFHDFFPLVTDEVLDSSKGLWLENTDSALAKQWERVSDDAPLIASELRRIYSGLADMVDNKLPILELMENVPNLPMSMSVNIAEPIGITDDLEIAKVFEKEVAAQTDY